MSVTDSLAGIRFRRLVWLLPVAFALHEAEEWNILSWYQTHFVNPPQVSQRTLWTGLGFMTSLGFLWTSLSLVPRSPRLTAALVLPFFIVVVFGNALQHVYFQFAFEAYAPGVISSVALNLPATLLLSWHALRNRLLPWWYVAVLYALTLPVVIGTARSGNVVPPQLQRVHEFTRWLAELLWGAA